MDIVHKPVLLNEVLEYLAPERGGRFVDGTLGQGGHAEQILSRHPTSELLGIDRDAGALEAASARLAPFGSRVKLFRGEYSRMEEFVKEAGWSRVDGILLDIGFGSHQLDDPARGFSFRADGPLDMRMDRRSRQTAATLLNHSSEEELFRIFREYGEESQARRLVRAVVQRRQERPWARTGELAELIVATIGNPRHRGLPELTRCFQALRIAVNDELGELDRGLEAAHRLLAPAGRLVVISFHSLEDRRVKLFFQDKAVACKCPPKCPQCICGHKPTLDILTKRIVTASDAEIADNSRAACAKLRAAARK